MLKVDEVQFTRTLFRAVKLDRLDATRILCQVATSAGVPLSSLREPESSATLLHVALLCDHERIVKHLIKAGDLELITATYDSPDYRNQTALHVAVANGKKELLTVLLEVLPADMAAKLLNTVADGNYFLKQHKFGQTCMTTALWAGHGHLLDHLVGHGARLDLPDYFGNTPLHSLIHMSDKLHHRTDWELLYDKMFKATATAAQCEISLDLNASKNLHQRNLEIKQKQLHYFRELLSRRDKEGRTVLSLAASHCPRMLKHILNTPSLFKVPQNKLGSIAFVTYDVTDVTTHAKGYYNKWSVLHALVHTRKEYEALDSQPLNALLSMKWSVYRWTYVAWLFLHLAYMLAFTFGTLGESSDQLRMNQVFIKNDSNLTDLEREYSLSYSYAAYSILPIGYIILELIDLFGHRPYRCCVVQGFSAGIRSTWNELSVTGNAPYRMISVIFATSQLAWFYNYINRWDMQDVALSLSLLFGWIFILFFTRACRVTSRFSIMMQKMFFRDLLYFLAVYSVIVLAFTFALNALVAPMTGGKDFAKILYDLLNVVLDLDQRDATEGLSKARHQFAAKLILIFYAILAVVLLMNMLIAMMNTSYETVRTSRADLWRRQQLSVLLMLERRLPCLAFRSERDVWRKKDRTYFDVTVMQNPQVKRFPTFQGNF